MNIYLYRGTGAYTLDALGVRHTSSQTDHDVTFSRSCDQGKIAKKARKIFMDVSFIFWAKFQNYYSWSTDSIKSIQ